MTRAAGVLCLLAGAVLAGCSVVGPPGGAPLPPQGRPGRTPGDTTTVPPRGHRRRPGARPSEGFREVRGLWVVRTTLTSPELIEAMVADADEAGFNTLLVQVRGRGDAYYDSRWEPRAERLADRPGFDPLALVIREAHARGMAVHAWIDTHLVWSGDQLPASPRHLVNAHPDWLAVPRELATNLFDVDPLSPRFVDALLSWAADHPTMVEGMFTSPSSPAVKERVYDVCMDLSERYDLDGIHLDYIRYPSEDFDYSRGALSRFRTWVAPRLTPGRLKELDQAYRRDPLAFSEALPGPWAEFRRAQITDLVERIYTGVKARRPHMTVSAAVFADATDAFTKRFQDWRAWLDRGVMDVVVPMAYTTDNDAFRSEILDATTSAGRRDRVWAGIGAYLDTPQGTMDQIDIARGVGVGGLVLFSYDWAVSEAPSTGGVSYLRWIGREKFRR